MKISRKAKFAISAMIRLGLRGNRGTKTLADMSMDQGISLSYLEQLFAQLRRKGIVIGIRGPGGGYRLAKAPDQITVASIISAVDEQAYRPRRDADYERETDAMWDGLSEQLFSYLGTITLADVLRGNNSETLPEHSRKVA
jgi:Rrf2 family iron-sulfur cluster assembly transcriptional regulator